MGVAKALPMDDVVYNNFRPMDYIEPGVREIIQTRDQMVRLSLRLRNSKDFKWDVETTGLFAWVTLKVLTKAFIQSMMDKSVLEDDTKYVQIGEKHYKIIPAARICGHAIRVGDYSCYIPIEHEEQGPDAEFHNIPDEWFDDLILPHFLREDVVVINHNIKFDLHMLRFHYRHSKYAVNSSVGFVPKAKVRDTMVLAHLCNENSWEWNNKGRPIFQLKVLGKRFYGDGADDQEQFLKEYMRRHKLDRYSQIPIHILGPYAIRDVDLVDACYEGIMADLVAQWEGDTIGLSLERLIDDDHEYLRILEEVYAFGIHVDRELTAKYRDEAAEEMVKCRQAINELLGRDCNPNAAHQVAQILQTKDAKEKTLSDMIREDPDRLEAKVAKKVMEYKMWDKVRGTYYEKYLMLADTQGYIHPELFQVATVTSRLACKSPNFQALPRPNDADELTERVYKVRNVVTPPGRGDYIHMYADYSQIEMNLSTIYAEDNEMKRAIVAGMDIHLNAAENTFGRETIYDQITNKLIKRYRSMAKAINFGTIYGMGGFSFSKNLDEMYNIKMSIKEASAILEKWHAAFIGFRRFYSVAEAVARVTGQIRLWTGRRRRFINPETGQLYPKTQYRKAMNNIVQGAVAEMVKQASIRIQRILRSETASGLSRLANFIHDDINMYIHHSDFHLIPAIKAAMEDFPIFHSSGIPVKVDVEYANWKGSWGKKSHWGPEKTIQEVFDPEEGIELAPVKPTPEFVWDMPVDHYNPTVFKAEDYEVREMDENAEHMAVFTGVSVSTTKYGDPYMRFEWCKIDDPALFGKTISHNIFIAGKKPEQYIDEILKVIQPMGLSLNDLQENGKLYFGEGCKINHHSYRKLCRVKVAKSTSNGREYFNLSQILPTREANDYSINIPSPYKIA